MLDVRLGVSACDGPNLHFHHLPSLGYRGNQAGEKLFVYDGVLVGAVDEPYPTLENDVALEVLDYCRRLHLGAICRIGVGAVVGKDVPAGATAVGNPAYIIMKL